jgi:hypothetical protein
MTLWRASLRVGIAMTAVLLIVWLAAGACPMDVTVGGTVAPPKAWLTLGGVLVWTDFGPSGKAPVFPSNVIQWSTGYGHFDWLPRFSDMGRSSVGGYLWFVPLWIPVALSGLGAALVWRAGRHSPFGDGRCPKCGYELAGLAVTADGTSAVCPECGAERGP